MKYKIINFFVIVSFFVGSTFFYTLIEQWTAVDSVLFIVSTITTVGKQIFFLIFLRYILEFWLSRCYLVLGNKYVGFGYVTPTNDTSKLFTIFVMFFGNKLTITNTIEKNIYLFDIRIQTVYRNSICDELNHRMDLWTLSSSCGQNITR